MLRRVCGCGRVERVIVEAQPPQEHQVEDRVDEETHSDKLDAIVGLLAGIPVRNSVAQVHDAGDCLGQLTANDRRNLRLNLRDELFDSRAEARFVCMLETNLKRPTVLVSDGGDSCIARIRGNMIRGIGVEPAMERLQGLGCQKKPRLGEAHAGSQVGDAKRYRRLEQTMKVKPIANEGLELVGSRWDAKGQTRSSLGAIEIGPGDVIPKCNRVFSSRPTAVRYDGTWAADGARRYCDIALVSDNQQIAKWSQDSADQLREVSWFAGSTHELNSIAKSESSFPGHVEFHHVERQLYCPATTNICEHGD